MAQSQLRTCTIQLTIKYLGCMFVQKKSYSSDLSESSAQTHSPEKFQTAQTELPTSPDLSPQSSSHTMSPQYSLSSLSSDVPLCSSSPAMHALVQSTSNCTPTSQTSNPSVAQTFSLSPDQEVIFPDDDGNVTH